MGVTPGPVKVKKNARAKGAGASTGAAAHATVEIKHLNGAARDSTSKGKRAGAGVRGAPPKPTYRLDDPDTRVYVGDCRELLRSIPECAAGGVDLIFADPPFNWQVKYDEWHDGLPREEYLAFTKDWLDGCIDALTARGSLWVNIPDDTAAEIVVHLKDRGLEMVNWCVWHYRFGQNRMSSFIQSKVHALYFAKDKDRRVWNPEAVLEPSDRATTYFDPRTQNKKEGINGLRVPMDVWYGKFWGRVQGNNKERRAKHMNQLPEAYLERVIRACSDEGMLVLDPFLGSGTTCTVARGLKRRTIGIEFSANNARSAFERIKAGPLRLGAAIGQSTAIFPARKAGKETLEKFGVVKKKASRQQGIKASCRVKKKASRQQGVEASSRVKKKVSRQHGVEASSRKKNGAELV